MSKPKSTEHGVVYDLTAIEHELRQEEAYLRGGHTGRTLVRESDLRVVLVAVQGGARIAEHDAETSVSIHALSGHVRLHLPERIVDLSAGRLLALGPRIEHDVEALVDSAFLLTLSWHGED
jgi:quercetin dioxygenase-like cupin family protein